MKIDIDGPPTAASTRQRITRLRAPLACDPDFAAGALALQTGRQIAVASLSLTVPPQHRARLGGDRPAA